MLAEKGEPVFRIEPEGRVAHEARAHFLAEANGLGREIVGDPEADVPGVPKIVGELRDILIGQIGNHPFSEHEDLALAGANIGE